VNVVVCDDLAGVGPAAWDRLHRRSGLRSPFLTWAWQHAWLQAFASDRRFEAWCVEEGGELVAVLPLVERGPGHWELLGGAEVSDYLDLLAVAGREAEAWRALLHARATLADIWELHAVPEASPTVTDLPALAPRAGLVATPSIEERCPVLELPATWPAYLDALKGKQRHELTRKLRRLEREVPGACARRVSTREEIERRMDEFLDLHRRSHAGKARFMDDRMERFFRHVAAALADRDLVRLWFLDAPEGPLAAFLALEWNGTVAVYNSGYRPDRAHLSPGVVLLGHMIRDAIARGKRRFDFLRGEERYKYEFGPRPEAVYRVVVAPGGGRA
jgi:CelD/BcsL family acetyltransferase involved in cellulose biosynthesis